MKPRMQRIDGAAVDQHAPVDSTGRKGRGSPSRRRPRAAADPRRKRPRCAVADRSPSRSAGSAARRKSSGTFSGRNCAQNFSASSSVAIAERRREKLRERAARAPHQPADRSRRDHAQARSRSGGSPCRACPPHRRRRSARRSSVPAMATGLTPISSSASITAIWASPRAPAAAEREREGLHLPRRTPRLARELPRLVGKRPHHLRLGGGVLAGRGAVAHAADDALQDRGDAEEIVGEIDGEMRPRIEPGARDDKRRHSRPATECRAPRDRGRQASRCRRRSPTAACATASGDREVGERIAERGELPVEHGEHLRRDRRRGSYCRADSRHARAAPAPAGGRCAGSQAISRSIASIFSVSDARYCFDQRSTWRAT